MPLSYRQILSVLNAMTDDGLDQSVTVKVNDKYLPVFGFNLESDSGGVLDDPHFVLFTDNRFRSAIKTSRRFENVSDARQSSRFEEVSRGKGK